MLDVSASPEKFTPCIRLLIADPQPIVLQGLKSVFAAQHDFEIVACCSCGAHFLEAVRDLAPDVALVAGTLPDLTASEILAVAKAEGLPTRLMFFAEPAGNNDVAALVAAGACHIVSSYAEPDVILRSVRLAADRAGALAKPSKDPSSDPSRDTSANQSDIDGARTEKMLAALTHRERQIVQLVSEGLSNKEIARELNVSRGTVKVHLYNIFQKLEVNNRTVLATIALLQRSTGFTTLSLALAFAIASDVDPSEASVLPDDASAAPGDGEHPALAFWKNPIPRNALDPDSPAAPAQKGSVTKESQVAQSAARIEGLSGAGQAASPGNGRGHGAVGSGASALLVSPLQPATDSRQAGNPVPPQPFPPPEPASNTIRNYAGHAIIALTAAGMALDTLDRSHAAGQVVEPGETLTGATVVAIQDGATHVAKSATDVAGHVAPAAVADPASDPAEQGLHARPGGSGNDTIKGNGGDDAIHGGAGSDLIDSSDAVAGGDGSDQPTGGDEDGGLVHRSAADSKSARLDSIGNLTLGPDRINLAAFGALAFLQLTSASQSIPPHTLAWIYNAVSNETIVYLNPTDRSLDIGDAGLLEIHLQGAVSAAEVESVSQPDAAAVAAALEGIDPALLSAAANDGTVLTADGVDASIDTATTGAVLSTAGAWGMQTEDGFRFHFGRDRAGPGASTMLASLDEDSSAVTEPPDISATVIPVHILPIEVAHSHAANPAGDNLSFKSEPVSVSTGAVTIAHGNPHATSGYDLIGVGAPGAAAAASAAPEEIVEPGAAQGNGHAHDNGHDNGHDNAQHASQSASADASEPAEPGPASGNGVGHGNSQPPSHTASAQAFLDVEPADTPGRGNSQASHPASANAADPGSSAKPSAAPGNAAGHSKHASNLDVEQAPAFAESAEPGDPPGHGNSQRPAHAAAGKSAEPDVPKGGGGHGNSQASHPASANAADPAASAELGAAPGNAAGHSKHASNLDVEQAPASAEPAAPGDPPGHGNSQPPAHAAAGKSAEPDVSKGGGGHGNSQASHPVSANAADPAASAEPGAAPGNAAGHSKHASNLDVEQAPAFAEPTEPGDPPGHGNSQPPAHAAAGKSAEPDVPPGGGGHGNSQASHPVSADPAASAEPGAAPGNAAGHSKHASNLDVEQAPASAEPAVPGDPPGHGNSQPPAHAAADKSAEPDVLPSGGGHGNSQALHLASANAADPAEPGNAAGHLKHASNPDVEQASASAEPAALDDPPGHGNSQPPSHAAAGKSAEPAVPKGAGTPDNSDISHPAFANAADPGAPAEPSAAPGNGAGNAKHASIELVEQASAPEPTAPSAPSAHANAQPPSSPASADMMEVNGGGHGNASQPSHASANSPASLQPAEPLYGGGKPDQAFQFKNDIPSSTPTAASDPTDFSDAPGPVLHSAELTAILETSPPPVEVHGASHVNNGQHHAVAHGPPDLLT